MKYMIESRGERYGNWSEEYVTNDPEANTFETEEGAEDVIGDLRRLGPSWAEAEYRVVPREP